MDFDAEKISIQKGTTIYKEGDAADQVYLLRSGLASLYILRGENLIELVRLSPPQIIGEEAMQGAKTWSCTAIATNDVDVVPIDVDQARAWLDKGSPLTKAIYSALLAKNSYLFAETIAMHVQQKDTTPCPSSCVTKLFAVLYHAASYTGTVKSGVTTIVWSSFKKYCQRAFLESPMRLEAALFILVRLGLAKLEMIPNETDVNAPEEINHVYFSDLEKVRTFYELHLKTQKNPGDAAGAAKEEIYQAVLTEIESWNKTGRVELPLSRKTGTGWG